MGERRPGRDPELFREIAIVAALMIVGGVLRIWGLGRLGLVHFDEGIYALAGLWSLSPRGLWSLDPTTIAYAPPGFPFLVGLAYWFLGVGDISAILVSIVGGTLTIPATAWVAGRTFGRGAGAAAAAFAALSGPHLAFSRMALTDASFLLFWTLAIGLGQRFLERPNSWRAVALGVSVGTAQLFKYNGWLAGVLVALSAGLGFVFCRPGRKTKKVLATWTWGLFAALVAAMVYWPWYRFVEAHGGYAALMAHHRSYIGDMSSWLGHLSIQLAEARTLSGGVAWRLLAGLAASMGIWAASAGWRAGVRGTPRTLLHLVFLSIISVTELLGFLLVFAFLTTRLYARATFRIAVLHLVAAWLVLFLLTPWYHPYARLWLPIEAFGWLLMAGAYAEVFRRSEESTPAHGRSVGVKSLMDPLVALGVICVLVFFGIARRNPTTKDRISTLLGPTDSLRRACKTISGELPREIGGLRLYARPSVTFYLSGSTSVLPQPSLDRLLAPGDTRTWALLDTAMTRQETDASERFTRSGDRWILVREFPTSLSLPTLLDIDPSVAASGAGDVSAPLRLLRPRRPGEAP